MSEYATVIIALVIIVLIASVICLGVSYATTIYENRGLQEEINSGFHYTIGINKSLAKDAEFLKSRLKLYEHLSLKYGCNNADELEKLIMDLRDKLKKNEANK